MGGFGWDHDVSMTPGSLHLAGPSQETMVPATMNNGGGELPVGQKMPTPPLPGLTRERGYPLQKTPPLPPTTVTQEDIDLSRMRGPAQPEGSLDPKNSSDRATMDVLARGGNPYDVSQRDAGPRGMSGGGVLSPVTVPMQKHSGVIDNNSGRPFQGSIETAARGAARHAGETFNPSSASLEENVAMANRGNHNAFSLGDYYQVGDASRTLPYGTQLGEQEFTQMEDQLGGEYYESLQGAKDGLSRESPSLTAPRDREFDVAPTTPKQEKP